MLTKTIRQNIHSAAIELIREHGWDAFTTEKIAKRVGVFHGGHRLGDSQNPVQVLSRMESVKT